MLNDISKRQLAASGWLEGRVADTTPYKAMCKIQGYPLLEKALKFVESYGGLRGEHKAYRSATNMPFNFDSCEALQHTAKERVNDYVERFGESMVPVGEAFGGHLVLMITEKGSLIGGYDDYLAELGTTIEDGLNAIFDPKEYREIGTHPDSVDT